VLSGSLRLGNLLTSVHPDLQSVIRVT